MIRKILGLLLVSLQILCQFQQFPKTWVHSVRVLVLK